MATGTGKTTTAIEIMRQLFSSKDIDSVIVCTYGNDLLNQWYKEIERWLGSSESEELRNIRTFQAYGEHDKLQAFLNSPKGCDLNNIP